MKAMTDQSPEQVAKEEFSNALRTAWRGLIDRGRRYASVTLLKIGLGGLAAAVLAAISLPILAAVACGVAVVLALWFGVYAYKLFDRERTTRQWAFVQGKRAQQQTLDAEQRADEAVLAIMGKPEDARLRVGARPRELVQALAVVRYRSAQAHAAQFPQPASAAQHSPAAPKEPDLAPVRARISKRKAEREALEAEIQALAAPGDIEAAMLAEEKRTHAQSAHESAHQASQAARERTRRGQTATSPSAGISMSMKIDPRGTRDVRSVPPQPTPEQIARGLAEPPESPSD